MNKELNNQRRDKDMKNINEKVYEISLNEIEKLEKLTIQEIKRNPEILKLSQIKNSHVLAIIKQQDLDYKIKDLDLRTTAYTLRGERNEVMKEHIKVQEQKLKP